MDILLVRPENMEQLKAVKAVLKVLNIEFTSKTEKEYDAEFVKKIQISRKQAKDGQVSTINLDELWK